MSLTQNDLEQLYLKLEKPIFNIVYRWVWDEGDAIDIVHEAFAKVWAQRDTVDVETLEPYIYRTALNLASNRRRWRKVRQWVSFDFSHSNSSENETNTVESIDTIPSVEARMISREDREGLYRHLENLPEKLKQVILLCEISEKTYEEVGEILKIPPGTVGSRRHRALEILKEQFKKERRLEN